MQEIMKEMYGKGDKEMPETKAGKLDQVASDIKAVADEMGIGLGEAMEQVKEKLGMAEMDDDADVMDDEMSDESQESEPKDMKGPKKALIIAMMKKKNGE